MYVLGDVSAEKVHRCVGDLPDFDNNPQQGFNLCGFRWRQVLEGRGCAEDQGRHVYLRQGGEDIEVDSQAHETFVSKCSDHNLWCPIVATEYVFA
jgi:hypothetical protein